jgi:hypothetical protein
MEKELNLKNYGFPYIHLNDFIRYVATLKDKKSKQFLNTKIEQMEKDGTIPKQMRAKK